MEIQTKENKIFSFIRNKWLSETPEEVVRQNYVCHLVNDLGYVLEQLDEELSLFEGLRGNAQARADIVVYKSIIDKIEGKNPIIVIECKSDNVKIRTEDYFQGQTYAFICQAKFFVTTNKKETKYFKVNLGETPKKLGDEIISIPTAAEINNEKKIEELLNKTKIFTRDAFTSVLFKCHNIIRNNDKLSPEAAFDEISKILFMKIKYEREQRGVKVFTKNEFEEQDKVFEKNIRPSLKGTPKDLPYMQFLFYNTKEEFKDDQLFEDNEVIKIRQNSFESILKELEGYNLSDTADDVKGIAFEEFLGKTFRGELGQFFTPRTIVDFVTKILDPEEGETICDPTCGSGGFLIKAFEYIREKIEIDIQSQKESIKTQLMGNNFESLSEEEQNEINAKINEAFQTLNKELENVDVKDVQSRLYTLSHDCIYGTDANPRMARTSKMNMIMHGDGHGGVHHHDGLLNINGIFDNRFDVILTNPPFGARIDKDVKISSADKFSDKALIRKYIEKYGERYKEALRQVDDNIGKSILSLFPVGEMSGLTEVLFIERCINLLKPGGRMGIVLPEGVLNTSNLQKVREHFEGRAKIIFICSIPQDVFIAAGATVKPSLVFFKKFTDTEMLRYSACKEEAEKIAKEPFKNELNSINKELKLLAKNKEDRVRRKELQLREKEIMHQVKDDAKPLLREYFNYEIPIASVEKAGITTTGAACENQLPNVQKEFTQYNQGAKLWQTNQSVFSYSLKDDGKIYRNSDGKEVILEW